MFRTQRTSQSTARRAHSRNGARKQAPRLEPLESRLLMSAVRNLSGFVSNTMLRMDDGNSGVVSLGFAGPINYYGTQFGNVFVNNNGNLTFNSSLNGFKTTDLASVSRFIMAPFFADADTRVAGNPVMYGRDLVDGHAAFAAEWVNVDYYFGSTAHTNSNSFQVVIIDRSDTGAGNFDVEFNYDKIQWEAGTFSGGDADGIATDGGFSARAGFAMSAGPAGSSYELDGSAVHGAFLDSSPTGLVRGSHDSNVMGRYVYQFRGGSLVRDMAVNTAPTLHLPDNMWVVEGADGITSLPAALTGSFEDPDNDSWAATVDYGDWSGPQPLALNPDHTFSLSHTYDDEAPHWVTVTVDDGHGGVAVSKFQFYIDDQSAPPLTVSGPTSVAEGSGAVTLHAAVVNDPDANDWYSYLWDLNGAPGVVSADGQDFTFQAADNGSFTVSAIARDGFGNQTVVPVTVTVTNVAPVAAFVANGSSAKPGAPVTFAFSGQSDPSAADVAAGFTYAFDFDGDGAFEVSGSSPSASHAFTTVGPHTVTGRIIDKDGGYSDYAATVTVLNVSPTAALSGGTANEGSAASVAFTNVSDSPEDLAAGLVYCFDFDGDGVFEVSGSSPTASHAYADNGVYAVKGRVMDQWAAYSDYSTTVTVKNVAPTAVMAGGSAAEGSTATVSMTAAADASAVDMAAGLTFMFDWDNDGTFDSSGPSASASHVFADNGTYSVRGRVMDKDGGFSDYATTVSVSNAAPVVSSFAMAAGTVPVQGTAVSFSGAFSDAGALDTHTAVIDWGDGTSTPAAVAEANGAGTAWASHAYASGGAYTAKLTVKDKDGASQSISAPVSVAGLVVKDGTLFIYGTPGADKVSIAKDKGSGLSVSVSFLPSMATTTFSSTQVSRIYAAMGEGDDVFTMSSNVGVPAVVLGEAGNDSLTGGSASDILIGGADPDMVDGNGGSDTLSGNGGGDILIAGTTAFDNNPAALLGILNEWNRSDESYQTRVDHVTNGGGINGSYAFNSNTVFSDGVSNTLKSKPKDLVFN